MKTGLPEPQRQIWMLEKESILVPRLEKLARAHRMALRLVKQAEALASQEHPAILVTPLRQNLLDFYAQWKNNHPRSLLVAWADTAEHELWVGASAAGCDLVINKGALDLVLEEKLVAWQEKGLLVQPRQRMPVKKLANPGQGLVGRVPDAPDGPIAIFRQGERLCAFRDVCPHAGFALSDGEFDPKSGILTCPAHGSQFQVCTGARTRGPADFPIQTYRVVIEGEDWYVEV